MNKKKIISLVMSCVLLGSIGNSVLADGNTNKPYIEKIKMNNNINLGGCIDLGEKIEYKILEEEDIEKKNDIQKWVEENSAKKGTYVLDATKEYKYVMISLGRSNGGGHEVIIENMNINNNILNIEYGHFQSEKGKMMRNISFPYIILEIPKTEKYVEVKPQLINGSQINFGGGTLFDEMTGEYNIEGTIKNIKQEKESFFVEVERNGAPMEVRINEDILKLEEVKSLMVGAKIRVKAKEINQELIAHEVILDETEITKQFKDYETLNMIDIKDEEIKEFINKNKQDKGFYTIKKEGYTYVTIFGGTKNTGGYSLELQSVKLEDEKLNISYKINEPDPNDMVTMAITYPMQVIRISDDYKINEIKVVQGTMFTQSEEGSIDKNLTLNEIEESIDNEKSSVIQKLLMWISELLD